MRFVDREIRRGSRYDAIIMDPPSYGRGPKGEVWKMEETVFPLIRKCVSLLGEHPLFFLISSYTTGLQPGVLRYMLGTALADLKPAHIEADEIGLPVTASGLILPCGCAGRAFW